MYNAFIQTAPGGGSCLNDLTEGLMSAQDAEKQLRVLSAIMKIHHSIGANLELEEIGRILVAELADIVPSQGSAILLFEGKDVMILAEKGFQVMLGKGKFTTDMPALQHIIETKQSIAAGDIGNSKAAACVPAGCAMNSMICTPVIVDDEVRGVIHLDSMQKDAFTDEDLQFVELLSREISIAIDRSLRYSRVKAMAVRDSLTGCYNRGKFDEDMTSSLSCCSRYIRPTSLLMVGLDWFKAFNDHHGHPRGDELLKHVTTVLARCIRLCDKLYRYGGEEFAVLLPETGREGALIAAKRICRTMEEQQFPGADSSQPGGKVTVSVGVASYPEDGATNSELVAAADSALYEAKQQGRNRVCTVAGQDR